MSSYALLPIGAFSAATQLSAKALRLYAECGILSPAKIDRETGYRYYRPDQVREARLVRLLREMDMPLTEISRVLKCPDMLDTELQLHMNCLTQRYCQQQAAFNSAIELLCPSQSSTVAAVTERALPLLPVLTQFFAADSDTLLPRAQALLTQLNEELGEELNGNDAPFIHLPSTLSSQDEVTAELCVPVKSVNNLPESYATRCWPAQRLACTTVPMREDIPDWIAASDVLFDWFDRNGVALIDAPMVFFAQQPPMLAWPVH